MFKYIRKYKHKKGFTIIELLVVIAVIAVLVLLAVPRFIGQTEKAKLAQIQNDIRVAETKVAEWMVTEDKRIADWDFDDEVDADGTIVDKDLKEGLVVGGPLENITDHIKDEINTNLTGEFYSEKEGKVYYWSSDDLEISVPEDENETEKGSEIDRINDLEFDERVEHLETNTECRLATDDDFSGETNGKFRYIGTDECVEIPHVIKGVNVTSYDSMFRGASVKGVKSTNKTVTDMRFMFSNSKVTSLDLSSFDTSNVTEMRYMFSNSKVTSLDLSSFDTSNVTNMSDMFYYSQAISLDLSSFDTSNVTDMTSMFQNSKVTSLDLSSFDTSNVTNMNQMFSNSKVTSLDLSSFNTSSVWNMMSMFQNSEVTSLDLSSFDTSHVGYMSRMFENSKVTSLDLSSFDTSKVERMANVKDMFSGSQATIGYVKTQADANKFNGSSNKPVGLTFIVKN